VGWLTTEGIWAYLHFTGQIPPVSAMGSFWERSYIGLVNGFTVADAVWSNLTLLFSIIGGWTAAIMANTIWFYSMTFTFVRDLMVGLTGATVFFLFFMAFAAVSTVYLWVREIYFGDHLRPSKQNGLTAAGQACPVGFAATPLQSIQ
jgi:hypothetical protein